MSLFLALFLTLSPERAVSQPLLEAGRHALHASVASNGDTMLAVWEDQRSGGSDVLAARVTRDGAVLDPQGIVVAATSAREADPSVVWDGTQFVVFWFAGSGLHAATVDLDGRVTGTRQVEREVSGLYGAVRGGNRVLIAIPRGYGTASVEVGILQPGLTFERTAVLNFVTSPLAQLVTWEEGFLLVWPERTVLRVQRLDHDARPYGLRLDVPLGPHVVSSLAVATDANGDAIVAAAGDGITVTRIQPGVLPVMTTTRFRETTHRVDAVVVHASGFEVVAAEEQQPRVYRFGAGDALLDVAEPLAGFTLSGGGTVSGGRTFAAWTMSGMLAGRFAFDTSPFVQIARHAPPQQLPALARDGGRALIAWTEEERVMAERIALDGTPLSAPLLIANRSGSDPLAAACETTSCALAWTNEQSVLVTRLREDLTPEEPRVFSGAHPAMATTGTDTLLAWVDPSKQVKTTLLSTSQITGIPDATTMPAVAFGRDSFLVVSTSPQRWLRGAIVGMDGRVLSVRDYTASPAAAPVAVAWNGERYLIVYALDNRLHTLLIDADGRPDGPELTFGFPVGDLQEPPHAIWDGSAFVVALRSIVIRVGADIALLAPDAANPVLLPLGAGRSLVAYQRIVPELTNVQRAFTRVITPPRHRPFGTRH